MLKTMVRLFCSFTLMLLAATAANSAGDCWVYGRVSYGDRSACRNCCSVQAELSGGGAGTMSKSVCTDADGEYRIDVAYCEVKTVFFKGKTVWEGTKSAKGGARVDITAR